MVTASGAIDEGINRETWLGLQEAQAAGLADRIDSIETTDPRDRARNIATLADYGYDVIITAGFSLTDETTEAAKRYQQTFFIGVDQPQNSALPNLTGLVFHEEQSGFLAGALAGTMTQTDQVAGVCEEKFIDAMRRYCEGFRAGVRYVNPRVRTTIVFRSGSREDLFNDQDWGSATATTLVRQGTDVIFAAGGGTAEAALEAAAGQGVYVIAAETDAYNYLPDLRPRLLSSALNWIHPGISDLLRLARAGHFPSGEWFGQVSLAPFHDLDSQIPDRVRQQLKQLADELAERSIQLDIPYKSP